MAGLRDTLKYALKSVTGNLINLARAGWNRASWQMLGGVIVGGTIGSVAPIAGNIMGAAVGGLLGSATKYYLS